MNKNSMNLVSLVGTAFFVLLGLSSIARASGTTDVRLEMGTNGFMTLVFTDKSGPAKSLYDNLSVLEQATGADGGSSFVRVGKRITCYWNLGNSGNYSCIQIIRSDGDIHN